MKRITVAMPDELVEFLESKAKERLTNVSVIVKECIQMAQKSDEFERSIKTGQLPQFLDDLKEFVEKTKKDIEQK